MTDFGENASAAVQFVEEGHNTFLGKADQYLATAQQYLTQLAAFTTTPTAFTVNFDFAGQLAAFLRPPVPDIDEDAFNIQPQESPPVPPAFVAETPDLDALPEFTAQEPTLIFPTAPTQPNIARPVAPPRPAALVMPDPLSYEVPPPVTFVDLNMPVLDTVNLPEFTSTRPELAITHFNENWSFSPEAYSSSLLTKLQAKVSAMMDGQEALPAAIERALFERGRSRVVKEANAEIQAASEFFGARGFSYAPGQLVARIDEIEAKKQERIADFNRDAMLKSFDEALANMRLAVQTGVQLEGITINLHLEEQKLLLQSMLFARDSAFAVLNARVTEYNALLQGYQTDAQVLEVLIKAELSKLEKFRAQIEAEKLKGDINEQSVRLYAEQWNAIKVMADFYRTQVEAVKVQADANRIPVEIFAEECRAFETLWSAHAKEWDGFRASVDAQGAKASLYATSVNAWAARAGAVVQYGGLKNERERLRIAEHGQNVQVYDSQLRRLGLLLETEKARLEAVTGKASALATIYRARADVESAASAATDRSFELGLSAANARVNTQLETARIRSSENVQLQSLTLEALKTIASIMSQLAAATMSAVSYSANVAASDAFSHARSVSWSGEAEDWNGTFV